MKLSQLAALALAPLACAALAAVPAAAQTLVRRTVPPRVVRRDIPLTNMIRRAFAAGTRDSTGRPGRSYWQLRVDYVIDAALDPATHVVRGRERVTLHNTSDSALRVVVLRLDQNVFQPNVPRAETVPEITEGMRVTRLAVNGVAADLADRAGAAGRAPRGGAPAPLTAPVVSGITQTVATVRLPQPIAPKTAATLDVEWTFRVPNSVGVRGLRMGRWADSLYQVAQWYPRVAVYDDLRGWDTDPYLGPSEFYNNFGRFEVSLDVPAGWLVGATGTLRNAEQVLTPQARERLAGVTSSDEQRTIVAAGERGTLGGTDGRLVWRFVADSVNDFAWATSDRFVWDATRATIPGKGPIPLHLLYLPSRAQGTGGRPGYAQGGAVVRHALEFYSQLWMPYAFPQLTTVDGPESGMEYPMFIMSSIGAADHEVGHQWWPMMVGTNETWYGWMDEGFDQYMNRLSRQHSQGAPLNVDSLGQSYGARAGDEREAPLMWNANYGGPSYSFQAYGKSPLMLSMLGGVVGDSAVWKGMSEYAKAWAFKHPSPWDFAFFMENALGRDLGWFWHAWLFTTESVDGSIATVATSGGRTTVTVRQDGGMPSPVVLEVKLGPGTGSSAVTPAKAGADVRMTDASTAVVTWPVDVWFDGRRTFDAVLDFAGRPIERITLDPGRRFPDRDPSDNVWPRGQ